MTRFLEHTKQVNCSKVTCKHCETDFNFKNKFHEHIREHHTQKSIASFISSITSKNSNFRFITSEFTYKIKKKSTIICLFASFVSSIFSATFTSIFESISSKCSNFSIATHRIASKSMKKCKKFRIQDLRNEFRLRNEFVKNSNQADSKHQIDYIMKSAISSY